MEDSAIQKILGAVSQGTSGGSRDYAILLLLVAYGVRGKQAAELVLDDINWARSTICFRAMKGGKEVIVPLMDAAGEAILSYLRHRPESAYRQVFLTSKAPYRPLTGLAVSRIVHAAMGKARVEMPRGGTNTFRHSWAIRALAHDSPMKAIADVLGHRCLDTTFILHSAVSKGWSEEFPVFLTFCDISV
jgi:integrase